MVEFMATEQNRVDTDPDVNYKVTAVWSALSHRLHRVLPTDAQTSAYEMTEACMLHAMFPDETPKEVVDTAEKQLKAILGGRKGEIVASRVRKSVASYLGQGREE